MSNHINEQQRNWELLPDKHKALSWLYHRSRHVARLFLKEISIDRLPNIANNPPAPSFMPSIAGSNVDEDREPGALLTPLTHTNK